MTEISLGEAGRSYMQGVLRQCTGAAPLLAQLVSKPGRVFAPLPLRTIEERASKFELGGLSSQADALDWLFNYLRSKPDGTLILEDVWSRPSDLKVRRPSIESYVADSNHVYFYLSSRTLSFEKFIELHKQIGSFQLVGFYIAAPLDMTFEQRRQHELPSSQWEQIVPLTVAVYISAYDQESWIVWESAM